MSTRSQVSAETIRARCAMVRSRWDAKTVAERRASAVARQQQLARQLGINSEITENAAAMLQPCVAGAA